MTHLARPQSSGPSAIATGQIDPAFYNADYFERGVQTGISGYQNYSWMPELTLKMAHYMVMLLPMADEETVLDYGCAKGFLVKALRTLDIDADGVDVSPDALGPVAPEVRPYCHLVGHSGDPDVFRRDYDWMVSKDVFEHMTESELDLLLANARQRIKRIFAVVPLGRPDGSGFVIPEYDRDATHVTVRPADWWKQIFARNGWRTARFSKSFKGVKDSWTSAHPDGNGFFVLARD
jgi:cyclopropane fatty-acyl-phospholipid synthase-like methyltransferase